MNPTDPREHEILERTLEEVRRTRRWRKARTLTVLPLLLVAGVGWLALDRAPSGAAGPVGVTDTYHEAEPAGETFTVVEWKSGMPSLVEYSGKDLGKLELTFSLEPVVAFPEEYW